MSRLNIFVFGIVLAVVFSFVQCSTSETESKIEIVEDINQFLLKNPDVKLQRMNEKILQSGPQQYISKRYSFGFRIRGDRVLATVGPITQSYPVPNDVNQALNYPASGIGAVTTYLEVIVDQSSNLGQAYIVSGGIGQRQIGIIIEARNTYYFTYRAAVYGY